MMILLLQEYVMLSLTKSISGIYEVPLQKYYLE